MKFVCNKQSVSVVDISHYGDMVQINVDGKPINDFAAKDCGLDEKEFRQFPARVTVVIEDLSDERPAAPDPDKELNKLMDMIRVMNDEAMH